MQRRTVSVLIEMPKGETRRIHIDYTRSFYLDLGAIGKVIRVNRGKMPIAYGFVVGTLTKDGDELDALVYSRKRFRIGARTKIAPIASLRVKNGDNKIIGIDSSVGVTKWTDIPKAERNLLVRYFGYKSPVIKVGSRDDAMKLINRSAAKKPLSIPRNVVIMKKRRG